MTSEDTREARKAWLKAKKEYEKDPDRHTLKAMIDARDKYDSERDSDYLLGD